MKTTANFVDGAAKSCGIAATNQSLTEKCGQLDRIEAQALFSPPPAPDIASQEYRVGLFRGALKLNKRDPVALKMAKDNVVREETKLAEMRAERT